MAPGGGGVKAVRGSVAPAEGLSTSSAGDIAALGATLTMLPNPEDALQRWIEDRCSYSRYLAGTLQFICDRRNHHRGMHRGRLFTCPLGSSASIVGYAALR